uniref:Uncharacterized protein n=1 Tax=Romanomermis culicivorax TaxID=13658 RepID=A0A915IS80_ROMCU
MVALRSIPLSRSEATSTTEKDDPLSSEMMGIEGNVQKIGDGIPHSKASARGDYFFLTEKECFRVDTAIGGNMKNRETGAAKYWYACQNNLFYLINLSQSEVAKI